jgi:hypothetical protein
MEGREDSRNRVSSLTAWWATFVEGGGWVMVSTLRLCKERGRVSWELSWILEFVRRDLMENSEDEWETERAGPRWMRLKRGADLGWKGAKVFLVDEELTHLGRISATKLGLWSEWAEQPTFFELGNVLENDSDELFSQHRLDLLYSGQSKAASEGKMELFGRRSS